MIQLGALAITAAKWAATSIDKDDVTRVVHHAAKFVEERSSNAKLSGTARFIAAATAAPAGIKSPKRPRHHQAIGTDEFDPVDNIPGDEDPPEIRNRGPR